jgi:hypothetical protein
MTYTVGHLIHLLIWNITEHHGTWYNHALQLSIYSCYIHITSTLHQHSITQIKLPAVLCLCGPGYRCSSCIINRYQSTQQISTSKSLKSLNKAIKARWSTDHRYDRRWSSHASRIESCLDKAWGAAICQGRLLRLARWSSFRPELVGTT